MFILEVLLDGNPIPFPLCKPQTVAAVQAIIGALLDSEETRPIVVRRDAGWHPPADILKGPWPDTEGG